MQSNTAHYTLYQKFNKQTLHYNINYVSLRIVLIYKKLKNNNINLLLLTSKEMYLNAFNIYQTYSKKLTFDEFYCRWMDEKLYFVKHDFDILGYVLITRRNEIGYFILPEYQRQGISTMAIKKLFQTEKRPYYWALIDNTNTTSIKFIQSLNFTEKSTVFRIDGMTK